METNVVSSPTRRHGEPESLVPGSENAEKEAGDDQALAGPIRLRDRSRGVRSDRATSCFANRVEKIVQESIRAIRKKRSEGLSDLESLVFLGTLAQVAAESPQPAVPELELFVEPVGFYEFRLHNRSFVGIEHPFAFPGASDETGHSALSARMVERLFESARQRTEKQQEEAADPLGEQDDEAVYEPLISELLATLFSHLKANCDESSRQNGAGPVNDPQGRIIFPVHPARRAAIQEWSRRQEKFCRDKYKHHREEKSAASTYPIVGAVELDGPFLALVLMSPLNPNFIDEKVADDERVNPVALAVFDLRNRFSKVDLDNVLPMLKQSFARVLFTQTAELNAWALTVSSGEAGKISRHWVTKASDGLQGLLDEGDRNRPFDPFKFCEAVVDSVLCQMEGVTTEVYPFDRVLIFREAGVKELAAGEDEGGIEQRQTEPIEVLILEAAVVSDSPADRGRHLTRRERQLRDTQDFECDMTQKIIRDRFRFYVHGYRDYLLLSRRPQVSDDEKEQATRAEYQSRRSTKQADKELYFIGHADMHDPEKHHPIDSGLHNLFGRIIGSAIEEKEVEPPEIAGEKKEPPFKTVAFRDDFRKTRLHILDQFDESGLLFQYEHGLDLDRQVPLLNQLLAAYNEYLDERFRREEEHFLREKYLEDSLSLNQIERLIALHRHKKNVDKRYRRKDGEHAADTGKRRQKAKAVYISFSPWLHEENAQHTVKEQAKSDGDAAGAARMLLGDEYSFTMLLVSDQDLEKNQARVQAERNDLKLYFEMLLRQIWMDKLNEYRFLARKSRTISQCLTQLVHRAKGLLPQSAKREKKELTDLFRGLEKLTSYETSVLEPLVIKDAARLFSKLLDADIAEDSGVGAALAERASDWGAERVRVEFLPSPLPRLELSWSQPVAGDAFAVILKNACEAAQTAPERAEVRVSARAAASEQGDEWSLIILVENTGGPIPPPRLARLNARDPEPVNRDPAKTSSTGIGVFVSRYQLQNVIGQGADLFFLNTSDNVVQVRLRLPGRRLEEEIGEIRTIDVEVPAEDYMLYVEDSPEQYTPLYRQLEEILPRHNLALRHCEDFQSADQLVRKRLPQLVLSDLSILRTADDPELPNMKNGLALLRSVMERGEKDDRRPPLLVLTAETEKMVRGQLGSLPQNYGYRFIPTTGQVSSPGTIRILSELKADLQQLRNLRELLDSVALDEMTGNDEKDEKVVRKRTVAVEPFAFDLVKEARPLSPPASARAVQLVQAEAGNSKQLADLLRFWFQHPGMPDPDPLPGREPEQFRLTDHVNLRRLLLAITVGENAARLNGRFHYWGLSRNIWFAKKKHRPDELAEYWLKLRHEERGPLSNLRHDLRNQWTSSTLSELLDEVFTKIKECEKLLLLPDDDKRALDAFFLQKSATGVNLEKRVGAVETDGNRAVAVLDGIIKTLQAGRQRQPALADKIDAQTEALSGLRTYLGGAQ